ncbi:hypothetical protein EX30DRAFT_336993 [Ascodesmis nigricans]|uniref:D-isomer specific 2-hydroxyacid dehydrogenase n=1 Tax=Ascodesmis nigricans TaxID=341454 RepID=A0A4S2N5B4_9PEZI|nr:hypothetical protein EX30DRAFT_336993 [Ascodesmis nigricans]
MPSSNDSSIDHPSSTEASEIILATLPFPEPTDILANLRQRFPNCQITYHQTDTYWTPATNVTDSMFDDVTIIVTFHTFPDNLARFPKLKLVHFLSAGIDHVVKRELFKESKIPLTTSTGIHGPQIAEYVFGMVLALTHHVPKLLRWQREKHWGMHHGKGGYGKVFDLAGCTLGILGYGSIGRQCANVGRAMGMNVLAYTGTPRLTPESRRDTGYIVPGTGDRDGVIPSAWFHGFTKPQLHEFLNQGIDVLVVAVPMTPQTRKFLSDEEFEILSRPRPRTGKGAYVVNIARGAIIDNAPLIRALKKGLEEGEGGLAGACLDVTDPEPLDKESELWDLENCIITPHISGVGVHYMDRSFEILAQNLLRILKSEPLINEVNRNRGY